ncbi:hypothetical protein T552_02575 [Pneumocystis carinii B80]|uniref:ATP-dependent RNA helicase n=1 Tax=Pneumocystis carinii (strain B80) TaxID=1408658 RepID=A0A0W4ZFE5_PNEC8|nr:hypothetical protein T552_02575 [Pneumocystis carinii B80]KTW27083.1 hypothetical protein T552_02575 [Pneumocystis carinii B80]
MVIKKSKKLREILRKKHFEELEDLERRIKEFNGTENIKMFSELPLSKQTAEGLKENHYIELTTIQKRAIPVALSGRDILGASRTGSGKTIAFLVPVLENLLRKKWGVYDGLGALIISPTRELATQIFQVLCKIGKKHNFSAGLVIGGKDLQEEAQRISRMNIMVCTPGRILQHMDQTPGFYLDKLQMLVLDEADRILDMGFQKTIDSIIENLPSNRQTLLFSATQTKSVKDLSRISLKNPDYIAVHEKENSSTPPTLSQYYSIIPLDEKINILFSFIKTHLKSKTLVFMSTIKEVRFIYETFRHLQPGVPLLHLYGRKKQNSRNLITTQFFSAKHAVMFCTDIAARGLDFPMVDWVLQFDCPEDADTYIHRVGRTARYDKSGKALLFLCPSEIKILERLEQKKVQIQEIKIGNSKKIDISKQLQHLCFKDPEIKYLGQRALVSYLKSIYLQKDKEVFKFEELPIEEFSSKMGLLGHPKIKFLQGLNSKILKNKPKELQKHLNDEIDKEETTKTKYDKMFKRTNQNVISEHYRNMIEGNDLSISHDSDDNDDFMKVKKVHNDFNDEPLENCYKTLSKRKQKIALSKKAMLKYRPKGTKLLYDDEGNISNIYQFQNETSFHKEGTADDQKKKYIQKQKEKMLQNDLIDKIQTKEKRHQKRKKTSTFKEKNITQNTFQNDINSQLSSSLSSSSSSSSSSFTNNHSFILTKKQKTSFNNINSNDPSIIQVEHLDTLQDHENLALKLLNSY